MKTKKGKGMNWVKYTAVGVVIAVIISAVLVLDRTGILTFSDVVSTVSEFLKADRTDVVDGSSSSAEDDQDNSELPDNDEVPNNNDVVLSLPSFMKAIYFDVSNELDLTKSSYSITHQMKSKISYIKGLGFNTCIYYNAPNAEISQIINNALKENDVYSFAVYSFNTLSDVSVQSAIKDSENIKEFFKGYAPDAVLLDSYYYNVVEESDAGTLSDLAEQRIKLCKNAIKNYNPYIAVGLVCDPVNLNSDIGSKHTFETKTDGYFSLAELQEDAMPDLVLVKAPFAVNNSTIPYEKFLNYWNGLAKEKGFSFYSLLYNEKLFTGSEWLNPVEIVKQLIASTERDEYDGVAFNSLDYLLANKQNSTTALIKFMFDDLDEAAIMKELTITEPTSRTFTTSEDRVLFRGTTDINFNVVINGQPAARNDKGDFAAYIPLKVGTNKITFQHKGKTIVYTITRTVIVIKDVSPTGSVVLDGSTVLAINATAYSGSAVTATVNGVNIKLTEDKGTTSGMYSVFRGSYTLPEAAEEEQSLGAISIYGTYSGISGSKTGATVTVKAKPKLPETAGEMLMVSNPNLPFAYSGSSTYYFPCPDQSFLPYGTLDYIDGEPFVIRDGADTYTFIKTRSGKRFQTKDVTMLDVADMGDNNVKGVECSAESTYLSFSFNLNWNAPFNIVANGISYSKLNYQDFNITSFNPESVVITFDYSTYVEDFTLPENPLFESYHWEKGMNGEIPVYHLVLKLKNVNCYTGYVSSYSGDGKLNIKFNLPLSYKETENEYGYSLEGSVIALSAGHGGWDPGAISTINGKIYNEYDLNKAIVEKLKVELEAAGAKVVICDALNSRSLPDYRARSKQATDAGAQIHLVIHQNTASSSSATGFETWFYSPFSYQLGNFMVDSMQRYYKNSLYGEDYASYMRRGNFFSWISDTMYPTCPTVLLETGFISNEKACLALASEEHQILLSKELTKGIIEYAKAQG